MRTSDALTCQSELLLPRDSSSGAHTATASLRAGTPSADSASSRLDGRDPLQSPSLSPTALRQARSHPAADARYTDEPARCGRSFAGFHRAHPALELRPFQGPKHLTGYHTLCLTALLYTILLTPINICYRSLSDCLSVLHDTTSHNFILIFTGHCDWHTEVISVPCSYITYI
jgi:hypothetical protein